MEGPQWRRQVSFAGRGDHLYARRVAVARNPRKGVEGKAAGFHRGWRNGWERISWRSQAESVIARQRVAAVGLGALCSLNSCDLPRARNGCATYFLLRAASMFSQAASGINSKSLNSPAPRSQSPP